MSSYIEKLQTELSESYVESFRNQNVFMKFGAAIPAVIANELLETIKLLALIVENVAESVFHFLGAAFSSKRKISLAIGCLENAAYISLALLARIAFTPLRAPCFVYNATTRQKEEGNFAFRY